jgi:hypothetical protein
MARRRVSIRIGETPMPPGQGMSGGCDRGVDSRGADVGLRDLYHQGEYPTTLLRYVRTTASNVRANVLHMARQLWTVRRWSADIPPTMAQS